MHPRGGPPSNYPHVTCRGTKLTTAQSVKYLGLHVHSVLSWCSHLDHLARKCRCATAKLWRYASAFTTRPKRTWYVSMVQSSISYASKAFFPSLSSTNLGRLVRLSKAAFRAVCCVHLPASTAPLLEALDLRPLPILLMEKLQLFVLSMHSRRVQSAVP